MPRYYKRKTVRRSRKTYKRRGNRTRRVAKKYKNTPAARNMTQTAYQTVKHVKNSSAVLQSGVNSLTVRADVSSVLFTSAMFKAFGRVFDEYRIISCNLRITIPLLTNVDGLYYELFAALDRSNFNENITPEQIKLNSSYRSVSFSSKSSNTPPSLSMTIYPTDLGQKTLWNDTKRLSPFCETITGITNSGPPIEGIRNVTMDCLYTYKLAFRGPRYDNTEAILPQTIFDRYDFLELDRIHVPGFEPRYLTQRIVGPVFDAGHHWIDLDPNLHYIKLIIGQNSRLCYIDHQYYSPLSNETRILADDIILFTSPAPIEGIIKLLFVGSIKGFETNINDTASDPSYHEIELPLPYRLKF